MAIFLLIISGVTTLIEFMVPKHYLAHSQDPSWRWKPGSPYADEISKYQQCIEGSLCKVSIKCCTKRGEFFPQPHLLHIQSRVWSVHRFTISTLQIYIHMYGYGYIKLHYWISVFFKINNLTLEAMSFCHFLGVENCTEWSSYPSTMTHSENLSQSSNFAKIASGKKWSWNMILKRVREQYLRNFNLFWNSIIFCHGFHYFIELIGNKHFLWVEIF